VDGQIFFIYSGEYNGWPNVVIYSMGQELPDIENVIDISTFITRELNIMPMFRSSPRSSSCITASACT